MGFFSRLEARAKEINSLLCVGLDPHPKDLSQSHAGAARDFCLRLIDATAQSAVAYKPNSAFFEAFGPPGMAALQEVIAAVPDGIPVMLDAKRGDIASTAEAYARAAFSTLGAEALTASPYLGFDTLQPFLADPEHGVFLLCKTSNPGSGDFQDLAVQAEGAPGGSCKEVRLYEQVARLAQRNNLHDNLGLVAGATHPEALRRVRLAAPDLWILAPGVGAQGGELRAALQAGLRADGLGLLLPVSRAISRSENPKQAAHELVEAIRIEQQLFLQEKAQPETGPDPAHQAKRDLADGLLEKGCVQFGEFTLKSGLHSPVYIDLRRLAGYPHLLRQAACAYLPLLQPLTFDRLAALPYAALPIASAISLESGWPMIYPRKETKAYGTMVEVEGPYQAGERAVVIDDLATTGGSKFEAIEKLYAVGLQVSDVVVLIDRQSGAVEDLAQAGYRLHAVFTLTELVEIWEGTGKISPEQAEAVRRFLKEGR